MKNKGLRTTLIVLLVLILATASIYGVNYFINRDDAKSLPEEQKENSLLPEENPQNEDIILEEEPEKIDPLSENGIPLSVDVPEVEEVADVYFDNAVFVGNSRTQGLMLYGGIQNAKYIADRGLSANKISDKPIKVMGFEEKLTALDALKQTHFDKCYIMLGINELGWPDLSSFISLYGELIDNIKAINPDALIYIQSVLPVSKEKDQSNDIFTNENIDNINNMLISLAKEKSVYYLDLSSHFKDSEGYLFEGKSSDGIHFTAQACMEWASYLKTHAINPIYPEPEEIDSPEANPDDKLEIEALNVDALEPQENI